MNFVRAFCGIFPWKKKSYYLPSPGGRAAKSQPCGNGFDLTTEHLLRFWPLHQRRPSCLRSGLSLKFTTNSKSRKAAYTNCSRIWPDLKWSKCSPNSRPPQPLLCCLTTINQKFLMRRRRRWRGLVTNSKWHHRPPRSLPFIHPNCAFLPALIIPLNQPNKFDCDKRCFWLYDLLSRIAVSPGRSSTGMLRAPTCTRPSAWRRIRLREPVRSPCRADALCSDASLGAESR